MLPQHAQAEVEAQTIDASPLHEAWVRERNDHRHRFCRTRPLSGTTDAGGQFRGGNLVEIPVVAKGVVHGSDQVGEASREVARERHFQSKVSPSVLSP